jgi:hypothetical protein
VVQGKLFGLAATVLADVLVTVKHLGPAQFLLVSGTMDHIDEADYRRYLKHAVGRVKLTSVVLQHFGFLPKDQHYCPTRATQVKGLVTLIKHQHRRIYHSYTLVTKFAPEAPFSPSDCWLF